MGDRADRHRDKGAREPDLERGRKIENVECLNQAFRHATIRAHAALKANASGHDLNRRVTSFGFNEKTLDFDIGKQRKFLSNPLASRDRPPVGGLSTIPATQSNDSLWPHIAVCRLHRFAI
ncbi:hypothetical protein [Paraburkholderia sp. HP33-1]|uniref:hypothetical protein n=1 Tax=Paraburkholderia sp. HP33-1 TaxID=2883243 RepID=UPI001F2AF74D|nr:hypothetical protein [Paraburkholderia sp. HP33-1]